MSRFDATSSLISSIFSAVGGVRLDQQVVDLGRDGVGVPGTSVANRSARRIAAMTAWRGR